MAKIAKENLEGSEVKRSSGAKQQKKKKERKLVKTGVIYIKHIPHGFYEDEMKGFFSQFGKVLRVCVGRSPKTGNSKGYGYVQFLDEDVAKIAAETMNNYLMFEKIVKCKLMPPEQVTAATFATASRRPGHNCPAQRRTDQAIELLSVRKDPAQKRRVRKRRNVAERRTVLRLAQLGIKYDLAGGSVEEVEPAPAKAAKGASKETTSADSTAELPVLEVDESDEEITFKTPPNVVKRRLSRPAASTPHSAAPAPAPAPAASPKTPRSAAAKPLQKKATPRSAAKTTPRSSKSPKTPRSLSKKASPKSATKTRSVGRKTPASGRKR